MQLRIRHHFYAAHRLPHHQGACRRLHGHRYEVEVLLGGCFQFEGPAQGMIADFTDVKRVLDEVLPDHLALNPDLPDAWEHAIENPTAELLAAKLAEILGPRFEALEEGMRLIRLELWETPSCSVIVAP